MTTRLHCLPVGDLQPHEAGSECWCHPSELAEGVLLHNAKDCREVEMRRLGLPYAEGNWTMVREVQAT